MHTRDGMIQAHDMRLMQGGEEKKLNSFAVHP